MMRFYLSLVMGIMLVVSIRASYDSPAQESPLVVSTVVSFVEPWEDYDFDQRYTADIFVEAEKITQCPAEVLRGIAGVESYFGINAVGDAGQSKGMFQLHSRWHDSRVEKYGEFDPFDPAEAAIIAGYIVQENLRSFDGDWRLAIAAYKQGVTGVNRNGVIDWYVDAVLSWRKDQEKVLAFFIFQGITDIGRMEDGIIDFGTQIASKPDDTTTVQVSWRGSSGFSY